MTTGRINQVATTVGQAGARSLPCRWDWGRTQPRVAFTTPNRNQAGAGCHQAAARAEPLAWRCGQRQPFATRGPTPRSEGGLHRTIKLVKALDLSDRSLPARAPSHRLQEAQRHRSRAVIKSPEQRQAADHTDAQPSIAAHRSLALVERLSPLTYIAMAQAISYAR